MHARITTITGPMERAKETRQVLTEQVIPKLKAVPGLKSTYLLADDATGKYVGVFLYETEADIVASREQATQIREETVSATGGTIKSVEEFEVIGQI
jgi:hypothetical protein